MQQFLLAFLSGCILFCSFSSASYADGPKVWFEKPVGFSRDHLTDGRINISSGVFGGFDLKDILKDNPAALGLAEKHSKYNTYALFGFWLGLIPAAMVFGFGTQRKNVKIKLIGFGALIGTSALVGYFGSESRHYLYEAVNVYNGVVKPSEIPRPVTSPF